MRALLWKPNPDGSVSCQLCMHHCRLRKGGKGKCGVRVNLRGELVSLVSDMVTAVAMDPVEKKPLYHFLPGTQVFSVGGAGCNFTCLFCQNSEISQVPPSGKVPGRRVIPEDLVGLAVSNHASALAFTYNEPTVFFEMVYETMRVGRERDLRSVLVTNGFMSPDCLMALGRHVSAANVDLKAFSDDFYRSHCGARLQPVLDNLKTMRKLGWWLEVTTLLIPGRNDSPAELSAAAAFIRDELGADTPWHVTAFHGAHQMSGHPPTTLEGLENAWRIGREAGLSFVYIGNMRSAVGGTTFCPHCGEPAIKRNGFRVISLPRAGQCPACGTTLPGVWN